MTYRKFCYWADADCLRKVREHVEQSGERGETEISGCSFENCKLMLKGNAYTVGKIIKLFTGKNPLKVLDMEEPLFEKASK
jgi:hypothetical protein